MSPFARRLALRVGLIDPHQNQELVKCYLRKRLAFGHRPQGPRFEEGPQYIWLPSCQVSRGRKWQTYYF
jgi:hypothetical protein